jgi:hypothetical protein
MVCHNRSCKTQYKHKGGHNAELKGWRHGGLSAAVCSRYAGSTSQWAGNSTSYLSMNTGQTTFLYSEQIQTTTDNPVFWPCTNAGVIKKCPAISTTENSLLSSQQYWVYHSSRAMSTKQAKTLKPLMSVFLQMQMYVVSFVCDSVSCAVRLSHSALPTYFPSTSTAVLSRLALRRSFRP